VTFANFDAEETRLRLFSTQSLVASCSRPHRVRLGELASRIFCRSRVICVGGAFLLYVIGRLAANTFADVKLPRNTWNQTSSLSL
jgi:hypothetical protein